MNLFRRKSVTELQAEALTDHSLNRALGAVNLTALGIGAIIGTGIFVLTGTVAAQNAGPAVVLSFVLAGVASVFAALCYSEFASVVPMAGSAYTYGYATLGELIAWIIGWDLILEYAVGAITVSIGWSGYVVSFLHDFGINIPPALSAARGTELIEIPAALAPLVNAKVGWVVSSASLLDQIKAAGTDPTGLVHVTTILNLPAVFIIFVVTTLLVVGIKESANFNNFIVLVKVAVVLLFIVGAAHAISTANWHPFIPANTGQSGHFGWSGVMTGRWYCVLRLHRIRRCQHRGPGGEKSATRHAHRHHRVTAHLHRSLHSCFWDRHWRRAVWSARRPRPDRGERGPCGHELDGNANKARCDRRFVVGHSRAVAWTIARVLQHGARRLATTVREPSAPALPHAVDNLDCYWRWRGDLFRRL